MKKRLLAVFIAAFMAFAFTGCGGSDEESSTTDTASQENTDTASESSSTGTSSDFSQISQSEIDALSDSQFYVANSTGGEIKELYVSESGTENCYSKEAVLFYTLNLKRITSPSLTTYSLPSERTRPCSFAALYEPRRIRSS